MHRLHVTIAASLVCTAAMNCFGQGGLSITPASVQLSGSQKQQFAASGAGAKWAVTWSISPAVGSISDAGLYVAPAQISAPATVTVTAHGAHNGNVKMGAATVTVTPSPVTAILSVTTTALADGTVGSPYNDNVGAAGGTLPYVWKVVSGALPSGMTLASSTGQLSGTPTTSGLFNFTIGVTDADGKAATRGFGMTIASIAPPALSWLPTFYVSSQSGNDAWSGLLVSPNASYTDGPFRTLAKAQAAMRASGTIKAATLRGGTYSVAATLSMNWSDAGQLWISYPGETAVVDGYGTGGITASNVSRLSFMGLTFRNLGPNGLYFSGGSNNVAVRWNTFSNCNLSCISGSGLTHSIIDSNVIDGQSPGNPAGSTANAYSAIMLWYGSSNNQLTHNLITNCQGGGIAFSAGTNDPPNHNNVVDRNILRNVGSNVVDQGAIYMLDRTHLATGNRITNNIVDGNGGTQYLTNWTKAIYLDDLMSNVQVTGNLCRRCGQFGFQIHGGDNNLVRNNIFDLSSAGTLLGFYQNTPMFTPYGMRNNVVERNIVYFGGSAPSSLWQVIISSNESLPRVWTNLYYSATGAQVPNAGQIIDADPYYANPQFASPATGDYSMPSSSPAYGIQFEPLVRDQGPLPYAP